MTYGIICPVLSDQDGVTQRISVHRRLHTDKRRRLEKQDSERSLRETKNSGIIPYPNRLDVLVGRGRPYQQFSGTNKILHDLIRREYLGIYAKDTTERLQKLACSLAS
jgi:hypothetical protein